MKKSIILSLILVLLVACQPFEFEAEPAESIVAELQNETTLETQRDVPTQRINESAAAFRVEATEGELVRIPVSAYDPDGGDVELRFSEPFNERGLWLTSLGDEGRYLVQVSAYDGFSTTTEYVLVIINRANRPPVIECPESITVSETETIQLNCNIFDEEGDNFTVSYQGWMNSTTKQTTYGDRGNHTVLVRATDSQGASSTKEIALNILRTNRAPVIKPIPDMEITETETLILEVNAYDPDGGEVSLSYSRPFDVNGVFMPDFDDRGTYEVTVTASDGEDVTTQSFTLTVLPKNRPPVIEPISTINVKEGETVTIPVVAYDPDGDNVIISYSGWMDSNTYVTTYDDAHPLGCDYRGCIATYFVTVTASDGELETSREVQINVEDRNRPPRFVFE